MNFSFDLDLSTCIAMGVILVLLRILGKGNDNNPKPSQEKWLPSDVVSLLVEIYFQGCNALASLKLKTQARIDLYSS